MSILATEVLFTKDGKEYKFVNIQLEDWHKFITWVQYKPFRDAISAELPKIKQDEIYAKCQSGIITEKVKPEGLLEKEEQALKEEDLLEEDYVISLASTVVKEACLNLLGIKKLMNLSLAKTYDECINLSDEIILETSRDFLVLIGVLQSKKDEEVKENPTKPN